jgi:hypothetical protein
MGNEMEISKKGNLGITLFYTCILLEGYKLIRILEHYKL